MNGMSFEISLYTRLKFTSPTRKVFAASEYVIDISVRQTTKHTILPISDHRMLFCFNKSTVISNEIR